MTLKKGEDLKEEALNRTIWIELFEEAFDLSQDRLLNELIVRLPDIRRDVTRDLRNSSINQ